MEDHHEAHRRPRCGSRPTGLTLAASLLRLDADVIVVDRLTAGANTSRAAAVNARTLEVLEDIDVTRRMVKSGLIAPRFTMRQGARTLIPIDFAPLPTKYPYTLMISQASTEALLVERLAELGCEVVRSKALTRLSQDRDGATASFRRRRHHPRALCGGLRRRAQHRA